MTRPLRVAVVGGGPRATYALERLSAHADALTAGRTLEVHVFERTGRFGAGSVHDPRQPLTAVLNRTADEVSFAADETVTGAGPLRPPAERPTLARWIAQRSDGVPEEPAAWPPRAVHGAALEERLARFAADLERTGRARVHRHAVEVVELRESSPEASWPEGPLDVLAADGRTWTVDDVLLVTGHGSPRPAHPTADPCAGPGDHAAVHVTRAYPLDGPGSVAEVPAGSRVALVGTGMTALDVLIALTAGRGGRFARARGGRLTYLRSGAEPSTIHCTSGSGVFPYARPAVLSTVSPFVDARGGRFLRHDVLPRLRRSRGGPREGGGDGTGALDVERDLLPLIVLEMAFQHDATLRGLDAARDAATRVQDAVDAFVDDGLAGRTGDDARPDALARLLLAHTGDVDDADRFDWDALVDPLATGDDLADVIELDVRRARQGVGVSPHLTARNGVWRDLRGVISAAVDDGGLTAASHRRFVERVVPWHNRFANGASPDVMARVAALLRSGLVRVDRDDRVDRRGPCAVPTTTVDALGGTPDVLVDAWVPRLDVRTDLNPLYRRLVERGAASLWATGTGADAFRPGGVRVDDRHHPVRADGTSDPRVTVLGPVLEGQRSFLVSAMRPGRDHHVMRDTVGWVDDLLARHPAPQRGATVVRPPARPDERTPSMGTTTTRHAVGTDGEIGLLVDAPTDGEHLGDVVVAPVFGGTARSMFPFAHALNRHGFRTVRVDFRHHVGSGSGEIAGTRLSAQAEDVAAVLDLHPGALLVAVSLATRPAVRALAGGAPAGGAVLVTPVLDVTATLREVIGTDFVEAELDRLPPTVDVLGYEVRDGFVHDARTHGLHGYDEAVEDLARVAVPVRLVAGDTDPWVDVTRVRAAAGRLADEGRDVGLVEVPAATHRLNRNPVVARRYVEETVRACLDLVGSDRPVDVPSFDALVRASSARPAVAEPAGVPG
ncbi:FAD/NAD(P)-binding protein [Cellulomonas fimi]|uniref:FAD/NAD(P)-binding protein n=1 Tax=Cellulomonas fimi TaxID=1708 RepID=UPI002358249F|nr:FAD/NAD(P)-binding protein [Cellulomonas fimi]